MAQDLDVVFRCSALSGEWLVTTADVREALSQPTSASVALLSEEDLDGDAAIGQPAELDMMLDGTLVRRFHLVVTGFAMNGIFRGNRRHYVVDLLHEIHLLALRSDVRIFQNKDAKEIVTEVAAPAISDRMEMSIQRSLTKRVYCVQYRETDFAFMSRLLEHEGIFYVIKDDESATKVCFADSDSVFEPIEGETAMRLTDDDMHGGGVHDFVLETRVTPARTSVGDYNLNTPSADLNAKDEASGPVTGDWFDYPAGHQTSAEGNALAKLRMEAFLAARVTGSGGSDNPHLAAGRLFDLEQAAREGVDGNYLLTAVDHHLVRQSHDGSGAGPSYRNNFRCIPSATPFRAPVKTPRARVKGVHSVVVTGPSGSEIHTDRLARMSAKFFWDRVGKDDETSSLMMRVLQLPIGGSLAIARVGWEMGVAYENGDPDRPLGIMRLYNAEKTSPYGYPAAKTRMSFQTPSSPGGGKSNEIRMEDGGGGQELFVNVSKDYYAETGNNKTEDVGVNEKREVGVHSEWTVVSNQTVSIGANEKTTISGSATMSVGADRTKSVGASETVTVSSDITNIVTGSDTETTGGSHTTLAALGVNRTTVGSHSLTVGGSMINAAGAGIGVIVAGAKSETVGAVKLGAAGGNIAESVFGAYATTVGGALVQAAGGNRMGTTKGVSALTVGGVVMANAAGKVTMKAKKINIKVLGVANFLGGGGILTLTPASASFVGLVGLDASGTIKISGNPNLIG